MAADLDADAVRALAAEIDAQPVVIDLADLDAVDRLDLAVDIVVNNAGLQHVAPATLLCVNRPHPVRYLWTA